MKKLSLDLNELRVETFATADAGEGRGTVRGHEGSACCTFSCEGTCGAYPDSVFAIGTATRHPAQCSAFCCA